MAVAILPHNYSITSCVHYTNQTSIKHFLFLFVRSTSNTHLSKSKLRLLYQNASVLGIKTFKFPCMLDTISMSPLPPDGYNNMSTILDPKHKHSKTSTRNYVENKTLWLTSSCGWRCRALSHSRLQQIKRRSFYYLHSFTKKMCNKRGRTRARLTFNATLAPRWETNCNVAKPTIYGNIVASYIKAFRFYPVNCNVWCDW